jgi:hypothetical protein
LKTFARRLINRAWLASCSRELSRFKVALQKVAETQQDYLLNSLRRNARTKFGKEYGFSRIASVAEYQQRVPLNPYETFIPYIESISRGEPNVLTADPVRLFQPTSGSTLGSKLIPWNRTVANEFRRGINPWLAALYQRTPALLNGSAYWSISPPATPNQTRGNLPVGFESDSEYLGFLGNKLFSLVSAVTPELARCRNMVEFRTQTLVSLLANEDLCLISVWSPTFLTVLLEDFIIRQEEILYRLRQSRRSSRARLEKIQAILRDSRSPITFERIWPNLKIISCWTHGASEIYAENLGRLFPRVAIQGKGLVATEAFVSFPFQEQADPVLAVTAHFFEFQDSNTQDIRLAHQLTKGSEYQVIVTTGSGLYRYPLGDRVRVSGFIGGAPCLRFIGREGVISDLFGEKLDATFVEKIIRRALGQQNTRTTFLLLAPVTGDRDGTSYTLFLETDQFFDSPRLKESLENGLAENFHYAHCRKLGQLAAVRLFRISQKSKSAEAVYFEEMRKNKTKPGDVKMSVLNRRLGWEQRFDGRME